MGELSSTSLSSNGLIAVVAKDNIHLTKIAVLSALKQDIPCDVMVFDNCSTDGTAAWCASKSIPRIHYPYQVALAAAWNTMLRMAWKLGRTHVMLVNNDIELRPDTYRWLLAHGEPFVTCVSVDSPDQLKDPRLTDWDPRLTARPHPDFSCFLIRREATDRTGYFDEEYFPAYYEDNDYHVRMHRAGIEAVCIDLPFLHWGAMTVKNSTPQQRKAIEKAAVKNRERFRRLYGCYPGTPEYEKLFIAQVHAEVLAAQSGDPQAVTHSEPSPRP